MEDNSSWAVSNSTPLCGVDNCISDFLSPCPFQKQSTREWGSCQQTHAVQPFSESIIEVRLFPPSYSEACLLVLKKRRWRAMTAFTYLFLSEHDSGNANNIVSKYPLQETAGTKAWILVLRGPSCLPKCRFKGHPPPVPAKLFSKYLDFNSIFHKLFPKLKELFLLVCLSLIYFFLIVSATF